LKEKNILRGMIATDQLWQYSEEHRELTPLNLLPANDQDPLGASPTMDAPIAGRAMADMFDDCGLCLASLALGNMVQHSGISNHELRLHGAHSGGCCQMTASDETLDLEGKEHPERHDCY